MSNTSNLGSLAARVCGLFFVVFVLVAAACSDEPAPQGDPCPDGGQLAADGVCRPAGCGPQECARGVCVEGGRCVNPDDCHGSDDACLIGYFCDDSDTCRQDHCPGGGACTRGRCERATGDCVDIEPCSASQDCVSGKRCLDGECTTEAKLCGPDGCPGNLICEYREASLSASCVEATPCEDARDCLAGRVCAGRICLSAPVCEPDAFEPNDSSDTAAVFGAGAHLGSLDASLCAGDVDLYRLDIPAGAAGVLREVVVDAAMADRELGLGPIVATLRGPDGESVATANSGEDGRIELRHRLDASSPDFFEVELARSPQAASTGIHYSLSVHVESRQQQRACEGARPIQIGQSVEGNTLTATASPFRSRCDLDISAPADIYAFEIDEPKLVQVYLSYETGRHFVVGLRSSCARLDTEAACENVTSGASAHTSAVALEPGRYFVTVQSPDSNHAGTYHLQVEAQEAACVPSDDYCSDLTNSRYCDIASGDTERDPCTFGCAPHTGRCRPSEPDTCEDAPLITESTTVDIDWDALSDDYRMPADSCVPTFADSTQTDGADAAFQIAVAPHTALTATLESADSRFSSLYMLADCLSAADACLDGDNADYLNDEQVTLTNESDQPRTVFVIADSTPQISGSGQLNVELAELVCQSWESRCKDGNVQRCNAQRTGYETTEACQWGCEGSRCKPAPGDACVDAEPLSSGQSFSADFSDYIGDVTTDLSVCNTAFDATPHPHEGPDAFFTIDLDAGDLLTATLTSETPADVFVFDDCQTGPSASCLRAREGADSVEFYAPRTATYLIGVDAVEISASGAFELGVDVQPGAACQPDAMYCDPSTGELVQCNVDGTAETGRQSCSHGCTPLGCAPPSSPNNTCQSAEVLSGSVSLVDDTSRFTNDFEAGGGCGISNVRTEGADAVYRIDLASDEVLFATARTDGWQPRLYLVGDCNDVAASCLVGAAEYSTRSQVAYQAEAAQSVYLVVDGNSSYRSGRFQLDVDIRPVECQFGETTCRGASTLGYCSPVGIYKRAPCQGACSQGECATPTGDVCQDAVQVSAGQTVSGTIGDLNALEIDATLPGQCNYQQAHRLMDSRGRDRFYRIDLQPFDLLEVSLLSTDNPYTSIYFLDSCTAIDDCHPGAGRDQSGPSYYFSETGGPVWVMVDDARASNRTTNFDLGFNVTHNAACAPSQASCSGPTTLQICNSDGTGVASTLDCPGSCARGGCQADPANANQCATAPDIGDGVSVFIDPTNFTNDIQGLPEACLAANADGRDLAYKITVDAGEVLHVSSDAAISIVGDCADPAGSCVAKTGAGGELIQTWSFSGGGESYWVPAQRRTVRVVADLSTSTFNNDRPGRLLIETLPAECAPGQVQCDAAGDGLQVCSQFARWKDRPCLSGCTNGQCDLPSGDYCEDAIPATGASTLSGIFDAQVHTFGQLPYSSNGNCAPTYYSGDAAKFYAIDMLAGDLLSADLLSEERDTRMYVLDSCEGVADDHCLTDSPDGRHLNFLAPQNGRYFLVVTGDRGEFTVQLDQQSGTTCFPGASTCDASTGQTKVCNASGNAYIETYQCANGCQNGACAPPSAANDTCAQPYQIDGPALLSDNYSRFNDDYRDLPSCSTFGNSGQDAVYQVDLQAGEVLTAAVHTEERVNNGTTRPRLYLSLDCSDIPGTCVAGGTKEDWTSSLGYQAPTAQTVFLVVDARYTSDDAYWLEVETFASSECTPGATQCVGGNVLQTCTSYGRWDERVCAGGCFSGQCNAPDNDTCNSAESLMRDGDFHRRDLYLGDYRDQKDLTSSTSSACQGDWSAGPEAMYRFDAQAGDVLTANWTGGGSDVIVWLATDCANALQQCTASYRGGWLHTVLPNAGTYWLFVDSSSTPDETVQLDTRIEPNICQPGQVQASCASDTLLRYCARDGASWDRYVCNGSCDDASGTARCTQPRGDRCFDAVDASAGGWFTGDTSRFADTFDFSSFGEESDAVYRVDLLAGQTLDARLHMENTNYGELYVLSDCLGGDPTSVQLAAGTYAPGGGAMATYQASADQTVWVVVNKGGPFNLQIEIN